MKQIELDTYEKSPENPQMSVYAGQRKAQEVFAELKHRLESAGMLPDEYFLLDAQWENGMEIPKDAYILKSRQILYLHRYQYIKGFINASLFLSDREQDTNALNNLKSELR